MNKKGNQKNTNRNHGNGNIFSIILSLILIGTALFSGCSKSLNADTGVSVQDEKITVALLGDLVQEAPDDVRENLRRLVHEANMNAMKRESDGNYEMSDKEHALWEEITSLLDNETIRQFGEVADEEDSPVSDIDYGKDTMANLKQILTNEDWTNLNDIGIFEISPEFDAVYQSGSENGLAVLNAQEQEALKKIWVKATDILPKELFAGFKYFKVGGDGESGSDAYVIPVDFEGRLWCMAVDPADVNRDDLLPYTLVHEMGHYLTLNDGQVEYFDAYETFYPMDKYADLQCVAKDDSYIQAFYTLFWKDILTDWAVNPGNPYFYVRHQSQFVTAYASTECAEDIAECFSAYVLLDQAQTPEIQFKMDFFDNYPELRTIKEAILKNR